MAPLSRIRVFARGNLLAKSLFFREEYGKYLLSLEH